jgi:Septum formation
VFRTACIAALLVVLAGCTMSPGGTGTGGSAQAETRPPRLGACRVLTRSDVARPSDDTATVPCSAHHTAQTFAIGQFPDAVARKGTGSPALGGYVFRRCQKGFERFVGADDSLVLRSTLSWAWFRSPDDQWRSDAHTWRCDVVGGTGDSASLLPLPRSAKGLLLGHPDDRWLACVAGLTVSGSARIPCSRPHTWRAVTTIVLGKSDDAYPGDRISEVRSRDYCSDSVGAWLNYPVDYDYGYTWFHEAEWRAGNRRAICWAKTDQ